MTGTGKGEGRGRKIQIKRDRIEYRKTSTEGGIRVVRREGKA